MLKPKTNISRVLEILRSVFPARHKVLQEPAMFLSIDEFMQRLQLKRHSADRANSQFSLIILSISKKMLQDEQLRRLNEFIYNDFRVTDCIGWIDDNHLGIMLHATDREGAFSFLKRLRDQGKVPEIAGSYSACFAYPDEKDQIVRSVASKRKSERIEIQLNAEITLLTEQADKASPLQRVVCKDISESGVYLETDASLELGQPVNVTIRLPLTLLLDNSQNQLEIQAKGKIVRKQDTGIGIAFESCNLVPKAIT